MRNPRTDLAANREKKTPVTKHTKILDPGQWRDPATLTLGGITGHVLTVIAVPLGDA
jgi:hypothetical protein